MPYPNENVRCVFGLGWVAYNKKKAGRNALEVYWEKHN